MTEQWRAVAGFEGHYEVSNKGNLRSLDRIVTTRKSSRRIKGIPLSLSTDPRRHVWIHLMKNSIQTGFKVSDLVYESFCGPIPRDKEVVQKNGNKLDNSLENLELRDVCTERKEQKRQRNINGKLKDDEIREIRRLYAQDVPTWEIAARYKVRQTQTIWRIVHNYTYTWVD